MAISKIKMTDGTIEDIAVSLSNVKNADDLKAIEALTSTGFLKRTGDNTWVIDANSYQTLIDASHKLDASLLTGTASVNTTGNAATATSATSATNATNASKSTTQSAGDNSTNIATTAFVTTAINNAISGISGAMQFKGTVNSSSDLPDSHTAGDVYVVATAGTYASQTCEVGDMIIGTSASAWTVVQTNIDGAVTGPASAIDSNIAAYDGTTGKVIKDGGIAIGNIIQEGDSRLTDSRNPKTHTHGNIANTGAIASDTAVASGDKLVFVDSSDNNKIIRSSLAIGSNTTTYLRNDGTWATPIKGTTVVTQSGQPSSPSTGDIWYEILSS